MTAHQSNYPRNPSAFSLLNTLSEKDKSISKLHKENVASLSKFLDQPSKKKINRTLAKLKNFEELEFQKILIMRELHKVK